MDVLPVGRERILWPGLCLWSSCDYMSHSDKWRCSLSRQYVPLSRFRELFDTVSIPYGSYIHQNVLDMTLERHLLLAPHSVPAR